MKKLLTILLLLPLLGFGQSTYRINTGQEPISKDSRYFVFQENIH